VLSGVVVLLSIPRPNPINVHLANLRPRRDGRRPEYANRCLSPTCHGIYFERSESPSMRAVSIDNRVGSNGWKLISGQRIGEVSQFLFHALRAPHRVFHQSNAMCGNRLTERFLQLILGRIVAWNGNAYRFSEGSRVFVVRTFIDVPRHR
jgi:hypothetical protein